MQRELEIDQKEFAEVDTGILLLDCFHFSLFLFQHIR